MRRIFVLAFVLLSLLLFSGICLAQDGPTYQISNQQLTELEQISNQLNNTTMQQSLSWIELNKQLEISKQLTNNLQKQVQDSQKLNQNLIDSLERINKELNLTKNALIDSNKSFAIYEKKAESTIRKVSFERDVATLAAIYFATKKR